MNCKRKEQIVRGLLDWAEGNLRYFDWRKDWNPYRVFVAEFLLKRTTSKAAERLYVTFICKYKNIHQLANAELEDLENDLRPIGLFKQRSKGMLEAAKYIEEKYEGLFPRNREQLVTIPHVGEYTAGCILSFGMDMPSYIIDSNIQRVLTRLFKNKLGNKYTYKDTTELARYLTPAESHKIYNYALIDFGAMVCTYRGCSGEKCPLRDYCDTYAEDINNVSQKSK